MWKIQLNVLSNLQKFTGTDQKEVYKQVYILKLQLMSFGLIFLFIQLTPIYKKDATLLCKNYFHTVVIPYSIIKNY